MFDVLRSCFKPPDEAYPGLWRLYAAHPAHVGPHGTIVRCGVVPKSPAVLLSVKPDKGNFAGRLMALPGVWLPSDGEIELMLLHLGQPARDHASLFFESIYSRVEAGDLVAYACALRGKD